VNLDTAFYYKTNTVVITKPTFSILCILLLKENPVYQKRSSVGAHRLHWCQLKLNPLTPSPSPLVGEGSNKEAGWKSSSKCILEASLLEGSPSPMKQKRSILCPPPCNKSEASSVLPRAKKAKHPLASPWNKKRSILWLPPFKGGREGDLKGANEGGRGERADRCRFFTLGWGQDKEDKDGKKTRGENRTAFCSVKLTSKSRNALFFVLTLPCLRSLSEVEVMVYLSTLSYLNPNLKKPTLVRGVGDEGEKIASRAFGA